MTDFMDAEARLFVAELAKGGRKAIAARQAINARALRCDPALREAVAEDCRSLAKLAAERRGYADLADLTSAGYADDFALRQTEIIAAERRQTAKRSVA